MMCCSRMHGKVIPSSLLSLLLMCVHFDVTDYAPFVVVSLLWAFIVTGYSNTISESHIVALVLSIKLFCSLIKAHTVSPFSPVRHNLSSGDSPQQRQPRRWCECWWSDGPEPQCERKQHGALRRKFHPAG